MSKTPEIDSNFLEPLESAMLNLETGNIPLIVFAGGNSRRFAAQVAAAINATVLYVSQKDFEAQFRASLKEEHALFVVIDQTLAGRSLDLLNGYLAARDVMGADNSKLAALGIAPPAAGHQLAILVDKAVLAKHAMAIQQHLTEFCSVTGVA